jgi:hypothetical protein
MAPRSDAALCPEETMRMRAGRGKTRQIQQIQLSNGVLLFNVGRLTEGWVSWPGWAKWPRPRLLKMGILCKEFFWSAVACHRFVQPESFVGQAVSLSPVWEPRSATQRQANGTACRT